MTSVFDLRGASDLYLFHDMAMAANVGSCPFRLGPKIVGNAAVAQRAERLPKYLIG